MPAQDAGSSAEAEKSTRLVLTLQGSWAAASHHACCQPQWLPMMQEQFLSASYI